MMASVVLLAVLVLCVSFPARSQDVRPHQEYVDKGYCTYTYVVPPGSRTGSFSPPRVEEQLAETKEETAYLKDQVHLLTSLVETLLSQQSDLTSRVGSLSAEQSEEKVRSAQLEQNLTQELQELETRLQTQCCERLVPGDVISTTAAALPSEPVSAVAPRTKSSESTAFGISISSTATELGHGTEYKPKPVPSGERDLLGGSGSVSRKNSRCATREHEMFGSTD
ncbi:uncharacterized protein LOC118407460 [Branchiostoma floridae]|uniref:Uncharacterized protein LOC118407460 n=1 Tax=Branchiostoma floridae TaxID=7739 RepID=A0A9J7HR10_BRAFL|nr:uncharacterized protein LOC118407460 [Branchiostoma floridae]